MQIVSLSQHQINALPPAERATVLQLVSRVASCESLVETYAALTKANPVQGYRISFKGIMGHRRVGGVPSCAEANCPGMGPSELAVAQMLVSR